MLSVARKMGLSRVNESPSFCQANVTPPSPASVSVSLPFSLCKHEHHINTEHQEAAVASP